jgi:two-component system, NarL family, response regulator LiaR
MAETGLIPVIVADDEWAWRESIVSVLSRRDDIDVVGQAETAEDALRLVGRLHPRVVLVDLEMPLMRGVELTRRIRDEHPGTFVLIFTVSRSEYDIVEALRAGASGYLVKQDTRDPTRLSEVIHMAAEGGAVLTGRGAAELVRSIARRDPPSPAARFGITPREQDVLRLLVNGARNRDIALGLTITEQSVKNHVRRILAKLGADNRTEASAIAHREGLVGRAD